MFLLLFCCQLYTRRLKLCKNPRERKVIEELNELYMTEETDDDDDGILYQHKPQWRSSSKEIYGLCIIYVRIDMFVYE